MIKEVTVYYHLGLGDHIVCNGLVRFLAKHHDIELFRKNYNTYKKNPANYIKT